jgi:putative ABC transport system ATP-binding protein
VLERAGIGDRALVKSEPRKVVLTAPGAASGEGVGFVPESVEPSPQPASVRAGRGEPAAVLDHVSMSYVSGDRENVVFQDLSAAFPAAALHLVMGRSGSGKTALLQLIAGLERPTRGEVILLGSPLSRLSRAELADLRSRRTAVIGQGPNLISFLTALENVELSLRLRGFSAADARPRAREALEEVGLLARLDHRAERLSAGEQQRVAIARALAGGPVILLADEPTARLDEQNAASIGRLLARAARDRGAAVICATHDRRLAEDGDTCLELDRTPVTTPLG